MALPDVFEPSTHEALRARVARLCPDSPAQWGKMNVSQMLAHCCIPYEQATGEKGGGPWLMRWIARIFFKNAVFGEAPFKRNIPTPGSFVVADARDFERERSRLTHYMDTVHSQDAFAFEGRRHPSWGPLTARQWSNLLYKHLDHHLRQFGA